MPSPFFIVGSGRSGTTLLRLILCSHSKISIPPETWFIIQLIEELPIDRYLTTCETELALKIITSHYRWPDMGIDSNDFRDKVDKKMKLIDIINIVYAHHLKVENKSVWGDKTPPYIKIIPELIQLYPDAKFIHLIRDGRDVAASFYRLQWKGKWLSRSIIEWKESIEKYLSYKNENIGDRILEIKYEDLVVHTERIIKKICGFIGQKFEPSMLNLENEILNKIPDREKNIHSKVFRRPQINDIYRWKKESSALDVFIIESYLNKYLLAMGYELKFKCFFWTPIQVLTRGYFNLMYFIFLLCENIINAAKKIIKQFMKRSSMF
ncbi:sulfotransferase [bacterium]|nr:sulfotransferase [bacterium]